MTDKTANSLTEHFPASRGQLQEKEIEDGTQINSSMQSISRGLPIDVLDKPSEQGKFSSMYYLVQRVAFVASLTYIELIRRSLTGYWEVGIV